MKIAAIKDNLNNNNNSNQRASQLFFVCCQIYYIELNAVLVKYSLLRRQRSWFAYGVLSRVNDAKIELINRHGPRTHTKDCGLNSSSSVVRYLATCGGVQEGEDVWQIEQ